MKETHNLTTPERDLLDLLDEYADYLRMIKKHDLPITLTARQRSTFLRICEKAKENPSYDYATLVDHTKQTFRGHPVASLEERTRYRKKNIESLPL